MYLEKPSARRRQSIVTIIATTIEIGRPKF